MSETLTTVTAQSIFDTTARHLRTMRKASSRFGRGAYRGYDGARCAVGVHLTDEECQLPVDVSRLFVDPKLVPSVGLTIDAVGLGDVDGLVEQGLFPERLVPHAKLLGTLQTVHDIGQLWLSKGGIDVPSARKTLLATAELYDLDTSVVIEIY